MLWDIGLNAELQPGALDHGCAQAARRLMTMACILALVLFGLTLSGHSHASGVTNSQAAVSASDGGEHCPGPIGPSGPGHCHTSSHVHDCCILLTVVRPAALAVTRSWGRAREFRLAEIVTAPTPRPPAHLAA